MNRFVFAVALLAAWPAPLLAQPRQPDREAAMQGGGMTADHELDDARARVHFRTANELYDQGQFERSAVQFEEAYRLSRRPALLYNAYVAYRDAGELRSAAGMLERYLTEQPDLDDRENLQARLVQLRATIAAQEARETELDRARREAEEQARAAAIEAAVAREQTESLERAPEVWPWIVVGVGGAALIASVITGVAALDQANGLSSDCQDGLCDPDAVPEATIPERRDDALRLANVTDVLWIGGAAITTLGIVLVAALGFGRSADDPEDEEADTALRVDVGCGLTGCALEGSF
jgi:tetratricopeptide (TPR) repeat protein